MTDETIRSPKRANKPKRVRSAAYKARQAERRSAKYHKDRAAGAAAMRRWRTANKAKIAARRRTKYAADPEAARARRRADYAANKARYIASVKAWIKANPEKAAVIRRNYAARKRNAEGSHTIDDVRKIVRLQRGRCAYCRTRLLAYHVDHIIPLSKGGSNDRRNLQVTCEPCNIMKRDTDPVDYARRLGKLL